MSDLATQVPLAELLVRAGATALIVVAVATAVGKLGPVAGGLVAGLPIGLGPGFYFLLAAGTSEFLIQTATHSLLALSATQVFLTCYMATARRSRPIISILLAVCIWWGAVWALDMLSATIKAAAILFIAVTVATRWVGRRLQMPGATAERREGLLMLLVRAVVGGVLVASVTVFAPSLGAEMSGTLLAFPIGYALISLTIHEQFGAAAAVAVVHSALLGTISLATFCVAFAAGLHSLSSINAFLFGLRGLGRCRCGHDACSASRQIGENAKNHGALNATSTPTMHGGVVVNAEMSGTEIRNAPNFLGGRWRAAARAGASISS